MRGTLWTEISIDGILRNEKYTGNMLLQKTYRLDHVSKKKMMNHGECPMYYVKDSHEAIIDQRIFDEVQEERKRRAERYKQSDADKPYLFTSLIHCCLCGKHFQRKLTSAGRKYAKKVVWVCDTFMNQGKDFCPSQRIAKKSLSPKLWKC